MKQLSMLALLAGIGVALGPGAALSDKEKVYRNVTSQQVEGLLKQMDIPFKKVAGKTDGIFFYDFERAGFKIRLHNYRGANLWLDAQFPKLSLEDINRWNQKAKFSRAVLAKLGDEEGTSVEFQLDCEGGVTQGMIRQFIRRFEEELKAFAKWSRTPDKK